ncbi:hypothetical protein PR001_g11227 [Phytophthora rubi]|uniref:Amino acid transporter transmembrane domain-containing protein n=1 Tax=Phytophthora rubi TaxID=129364 RepID=A0A6A3M9T4_9STRA|nr:hypothetical protein PR002_g11304 [Phytophthora rubi]KAE9030570.1 hypothetical protein PR001_g11227 [Phytophthora rubi]
MPSAATTISCFSFVLLSFVSGSFSVVGAVVDAFAVYLPTVIRGIMSYHYARTHRGVRLHRAYFTCEPRPPRPPRSSRPVGRHHPSPLLR